MTKHQNLLDLLAQAKQSKHQLLNHLAVKIYSDLQTNNGFADTEANEIIVDIESAIEFGNPEFKEELTTLTKLKEWFTNMVLDKQ